MAKPPKKTLAPIEAETAGAPAALKAVQEHELRARDEMNAAHETRKRAQANWKPDDDALERTLRQANTAYTDALEIWNDSLQKLLVYDAKISVERREGEKIAISEAKEYFRQYELTIHLAVEAYIIQISQAAALCESPEEFHIKHADAIRSAKAGATEKAVRDGKLPGWLLE